MFYKTKKVLLICSVIGLVPLTSTAGTISGTLHVKGLRSPENILVYLDKIETKVPPASFVMDQKNLTFLPDLLPIPAGSSVKFPNNDKVNHNVFSLSKTAPFNLGTYGPGQAKTMNFDTPGLVQLRCDVHAEMIAHIAVMKNPYYSLTTAQGTFRIPDPAQMKQTGSISDDIPAGTYRLRIWHSKLRPISQKIVVPSKGAVTVELVAKRGPKGSVLYK